MENENPLAWWELGRTRTVVAISFLVGLGFALLGLFPDVHNLYVAYPALKDIIEALVGVSGLFLAFLELRHSDEANRHRAERNRLAEKANSLSLEKNNLHQKTLDLQREVHDLQRQIEETLTKVRLYARARSGQTGIELLVSNLSDFDLWINQVRLIVTAIANGTPGTDIIGGGNRISRGNTENGYPLYGKLISANGDRTDRIDMRFYVQVEAVGVSDDPVEVNSPEYHFTYRDGRRELNVVRHL